MEHHDELLADLLQLPRVMIGSEVEEAALSRSASSRVAATTERHRQRIF